MSPRFWFKLANAYGGERGNGSGLCCRVVTEWEVIEDIEN